MVPRLLLTTLTLTSAVEALSIAQPASNDRQREGAVAILISGMFDRLLVSPLVENLVRANAEAGTLVDTYFSMKPPSEQQNYAANKGESKWLVTEEAASKYTVDPLIESLRSGQLDTKDQFLSLCHFAKEAGAGVCRSGPEAEEDPELPDDDVHREMMSYYNPLTTASGKNVLKRWRTIEKLWGQAKEVEQAKGFLYNSVLVVRDDDYWLTPYIFNTTEFRAHPNSLKSISCLEAHGINDKMIHLGRKAVEKAVTTYQAWLEVPNDALRTTRNAEEFLFKLAMLRGVGLRPSGFNYALGTSTVSGIPCFRKQSFNLTARGGYRQCHDETSENGPVTKLFRTFSCDAMNPAFYEAVNKNDVAALQRAVAKAAGDGRKPVVLTVVEGSRADAASRTLESLAKSVGPDEEGNTRAVAVADQGFVCDRLRTLPGMPVCIVVSTSVKSRQAKIALLTTALSSSAARGILFVEPGVELAEDPVGPFVDAGQGRDIVFAPSRGGAQCKEVSDDGQASSSIFYVKSTPGGTHALMRAWMFLVEGPLAGDFYAGEPVASAINYEIGGHRLAVGDHGIIRGASHKDPDRVVVDFKDWSGLALLPKQVVVSSRGGEELVARAAATSTGVRPAATKCARLGWEQLPEAS